MTASNRRKPQRGAAVTRAQAMALLAQGLTVAEVARRTGLHRRTVEKWRATEAGAAALDAAKGEAAAAFASTVEAARARLTGAAAEATDVLLTVLRSDRSDAQDKLRAAGMIFDRVGLPRTQRVEQDAPPVDLSKLTPEELDQYEALQRKLHRVEE